MKIAKNVGEDSLITSAYLSEMVAQRKIKLSDLKIGTSPLYYLPGQEAQLVNFVSEFKTKDLDVWDKLKNYGVLREADQELLAKVALRKMKDFAMPLQVNFQGQKELFWKWYLLSDEETNAKISELLDHLSDGSQEDTNQETPVEQEANSVTAEVESETFKEELAQEQIIEKHGHPESVVSQGKINEKDKPESESYPPDTTKRLPEQVNSESYPPDTSKKEEHSEKEPAYPPITAEIEDKEELTEEEVNEEPVVDKEAEEISSQAKEEKKEEDEEKDKKQREDLKEFTKDKQKVLTEDHDQKEDKEKDIKPKKSFVAKIKDKITGTKRRKKVEEEFMPTIMKYLAELNIDIDSHEIIRKNSEFNLTIRVPSVVGKLTYYCKAKNKKNCDEKDLSAAYMEAQMKKMPLLFLYSDKINKKAEELLDSGTFDNLIAKKIELDEEEIGDGKKLLK